MAGRTLWGALCVFVLVFFGSAAAGAQQKADAAPRFALGVAVPLSGEYAALGEAVATAARVAAAERGGRVIVRDTLGTPAGAMAAIDALAGDPAVLAVLGPLGRRESQAAARAAHRQGVPLFSLAADARVNASSGWVFRLTQSPGEQAAALAEAVRKEFGAAKRVGILFPESPYGSQAALAFAERFSALGGQVRALASYPSDTTDFRKALDTLVGKKMHIGRAQRAGKKRADRDGYLSIRGEALVDFDLLFIPDYHANIARLLAFLPGAGIQNGDGGQGVAVQLLGLSGWQGASMRMSGALAAGAIFSDIFAGEADGGSAQEFELLFEEKTGRLPVNLDAEVFDATLMLGQIIDALAASAPDEGAAGELRRQLLRRLPRAGAAPANDAFYGVSGALRFDAQGAPLRPTRLYQFDVGGSVAPWR